MSLTLLASSAWAQSSQGTISGIVLDASQAAVPAAQITLTELDTNTERQASSGVDGSYSFPNLVAGDYSLRVSAQGFRPYEQTRVSVRVNQLVRLDVRLEVGSVTEVVTVTADASPLNFENATRQEGVSPEIINELPLIVSGGVRNAANFAVLAPGVNTGGGQAEAFRSRINGGIQSGDEAIMDGVSMQQGTMSQTGMISFWDFPMTPDMVSEFKVLTTNYEPQYGASTSAQIIVETKAGGPEYHGAAYWYHRNTVLNARQFGADARPKDIEHDYGVAIGGPFPLAPLINKDPLSTFFYFNYERYSVKGGVSRPTISIPSLKQRNGDFTDWVDADGNLIPVFDPATTATATDGTITRQQFNCQGVPNVICPSRITNSLANDWLQLLPQPTNNNALNNFQAPAPIPDSLISDVKYYIGRVDNYVGNKGHLYFSVWHQSAAPVLESLLPRAITDSNFSDPQNSWIVRANYDITFSPTLVNHFAYGYLNRNEGYGSLSLEEDGSLPRVPGVPSNASAPTIRFSDDFTGYGNSDGLNTGNKTTRPSHIMNDLVTWVRGSHTIKFGGEFRHIGQVFNDGTNESGVFNFNRGATRLLGVNSGNPIASFLLEQVGDADVNLRTVNRWVAQARAYVFHIGDTWRITPKLTFNYGIRWDYFTPSWEEDDQLSFFDSEGPNARAGGRRGRLAFAGNDAGEASFGARYPENAWKNGWAPRIGLAYALNEKTVIRTGFGISYTQAFYPNWGGGMSLDGFNNNISRSSTQGGLVPAFIFSQGFPAPTAEETPPFINSGFRNGQDVLYRPFEANRRSYSGQWNLTIERQILADSHVSIAYVGNRGVRLPSAMAGLNALNPSLLSMGDQLRDEFQPGQTSLHGVPVPYDGWVEQMVGCAPSVAQALLPYPQYCSNLRGLNENAGTSSYHSFQAKYEQRFRSGTFILMSYTFSKLLTTSGHVDSDAATWSGLAGVISPFERERNYALASDDVPHIFSLAFVHELPFGRGKKYGSNVGGGMNHLVGGWEISGVLRASSGIPTFFRSGQCNIPGAFQMGCLPAITGSSPFTADHGAFLDNFDIDTSRLYSTDRFQPVDVFNYYGGAGPTVSNFRTFGYSNIDFTIVKNIPFGEKLNIQLRGEFFNILNQHHLVASGSAADRGGTYAFNNDIASPDFGSWNGTVTPPRNIQLGVRIEF
jgi:hypothetical protein